MAMSACSPSAVAVQRGKHDEKRPSSIARRLRRRSGSVKKRCARCWLKRRRRLAYSSYTWNRRRSCSGWFAGTLQTCSLYRNVAKSLKSSSVPALESSDTAAANSRSETRPLSVSNASESFHSKSARSKSLWSSRMICSVTSNACSSSCSSSCCAVTSVSATSPPGAPPAPTSSRGARLFGRMRGLGRRIRRRPLLLAAVPPPPDFRSAFPAFLLPFRPSPAPRSSS
mmetsp:Transcript_5698/g.19459  ORF Transcript_5698/g.19459 Transcript_5698/m.19459 type:complete len:227 (-) Transcript_5698:481-1161(-)